jgi:hypothetical protein
MKLPHIGRKLSRRVAIWHTSLTISKRGSLIRGPLLVTQAQGITPNFRPDAQRLQSSREILARSERLGTPKSVAAGRLSIAGSPSGRSFLASKDNDLVRSKSTFGSSHAVQIVPFKGRWAGCKYPLLQNESDPHFSSRASSSTRANTRAVNATSMARAAVLRAAAASSYVPLKHRY